MKKYVVSEGDTMWSISEATGVKTNLLIAANPQIKNPNQLRPGTVVVIPELTKPKTPVSGSLGQPGSGTKSQAQKPASVQDPGTVASGTVAKGTVNKQSQGPPHLHDVPSTQSAGMTGQGKSVVPFFGFVWPHVVQKGETWSSLRQTYHVSSGQLHQLNPSLANRDLQPGDLVYVPGMVPPSHLPSQGSAMPDGTTAGMGGGPGYGQMPSPGYGQMPSPGYGQMPSPGYGQMPSPGYGQMPSPYPQSPYQMPGGQPGQMAGYGAGLPTGVNPAQATPMQGPHQHHPHRLENDVDPSIFDESSWESQWEGGGEWRNSETNGGLRHPSWPETGSSTISVYLGDPDAPSVDN